MPLVFTGLTQVVACSKQGPLAACTFLRVRRAGLMYSLLAYLVVWPIRWCGVACSVAYLGVWRIPLCSVFEVVWGIWWLGGWQLKC